MKKLFIITGEHSGDKHASCVVRELKKINPNCIIEAIGGENLQSEGVKLFGNHSKMGKVGLDFKTVFDHLTLGLKLVKYLKEEFKPDLVLLVDYGAFNLAISKHLKKAGFKIFYFIPPQVWASRKWRLKTIKKNIDKVLTIFPFEKEMYDENKIEAQYVGHPLYNEMTPQVDRIDFFKKFNLDLDKKLISIFPGSRKFELDNLLKPFSKCADIIKSKGNYQVVFSKAPNFKDGYYEHALKKNGIDCKIIEGNNHELLSVSDGAILASGTVALESAFYETPTVIAYRGPLFFYFIYLLVRSIKQACLVNIVTKKNIVPEFLMFDVCPNKITSTILNLIEDKEAQEKQKEGFREVKNLLHKGNCTEKVANILNEELS